MLGETKTRGKHHAGRHGVGQLDVGALVEPLEVIRPHGRHRPTEVLTGLPTPVSYVADAEAEPVGEDLVELGRVRVIAFLLRESGLWAVILESRSVRSEVRLGDELQHLQGYGIQPFGRDAVIGEGGANVRATTQPGRQ